MSVLSYSSKGKGKKRGILTKTGEGSSMPRAARQEHRVAGDRKSTTSRVVFREHAALAKTDFSLLDPGAPEAGGPAIE
jgi:hypothetical protein